MNYSHTISPEELERIERFLTNKMDEVESRAFSLELEANPSLREKTAEVKLLLLAISEHSLEKRLDGFHEEMISPRSSLKENVRVISIRRKWLIAASVLAVVMLSVWGLMQRGDSNKRLYSDYYTPDPGLATVMSSSGDYDFQKAMVEYKNKQYDKALEAWTALLKEKPANDTLAYFLAATYQAKGDNDRAIEKLQQVVADTASAFNKDACWYLGLSYLKKGQLEQAAGYIQRSGHPESFNILKAINKK